MRIIFDFRNVGCGNNGGTSTIVKSANVLKKLGHEIFLIDSGPLKYTWSEVLVPHIIVKQEKDIPDSDVIIATGYNSVIPTVQSPKRCGRKYHWIRGWETWQYSEQVILQKVLSQPTIKIVNSICLQEKLQEYNVPSTIVYPGYDLNELYPMNIRDRDIIVLGGLYNIGKTTKRTDWIFQAFKRSKTIYKDIELWMFGNDKNVSISLCKYLSQPDSKEKNRFYNHIDIWIAPSCQEGLHLPPAEAMLTGCPVVCTDAPLSGMKDYVINGQTGLVTSNDLTSFISGVCSLILDKEKRLFLSSNARNKILEIGDREKNMKKFLMYLKENLDETKIFYKEL